MKKFNITHSSQLVDTEFFGNPDAWTLISKASNHKEKWMKSTKAMEISGVGCVIQVSTQQNNNVAESVVFVPETRIKTDENGIKSIIVSKGV